MKNFFIGTALAFVLFFGVPSTVFASNSINCDSPDDPLGVGCASASGLSNNDIRFTVGRIINVSLGLLGAITLSLMVYAGFLWTTSAGNEEKVGQAKGIMYGAVIGLVIIMSAYTISYFILRQISSATSTSRTLGTQQL